MKKTTIGKVIRYYKLSGEVTMEHVANLVDKAFALPTKNKQRITGKYTRDVFTTFLMTGFVSAYIRHISDGKTNKYLLIIRNRAINPVASGNSDRVTLKITEEQYTWLRRLCNNEPIQLRTLEYTVGKTTIFVNTMDPGAESSISTAAVSFNTEEQADAFVWPFEEITATDVTNDPQYKHGRKMTLEDYWKKYRVENG